MLDIKYVVENTQAVKQALAGRNGEFPVEKAVELELKRRETIKEVETLKARRNSESAKVAQLKREKKNADDIIADMQKTGVRIKELDDILSSTEAELKELMLSIPNIPHSTTPFGKSDADNVEVRNGESLRVSIFRPSRIGSLARRSICWIGLAPQRYPVRDSLSAAAPPQGLKEALFP